MQRLVILWLLLLSSVKCASTQERTLFGTLGVQTTVAPANEKVPLALGHYTHYTWHYHFTTMALIISGQLYNVELKFAYQSLQHLDCAMRTLEI